ncbi:MAG: DUF3365 domain-containing protein [Gammaproteobacteria bacterium]|jgi:hypothetical protein|nr:DUF3365 domain-containing protein [Gammaproteobacteria bacterium]MBT7308631.1 DUF3365 domain-containing protein [Gammaproteobacteria bacterium]
MAEIENRGGLLTGLFSRWKIVLLLVLWTLLCAISLSHSYTRLEQQLEYNLRTEGGTVFELLVLMRRWNAEHNGVYVPLTEASPSNPYLTDPQKDILSNRGQNLTKVNPAYMTRQLSEMAPTESPVQFRILSLKPLNPINKPDQWEAESLLAFEQGALMKSTLEQRLEGTFFRYIAPLITTSECLKCHARQGYQKGDVRGGLSIALRVNQRVAMVKSEKRESAVLHGVIYLLVALLLILLGRTRNTEARRP